MMDTKTLFLGISTPLIGHYLTNIRFFEKNGKITSFVISVTPSCQNFAIQTIPCMTSSIFSKFVSVPTYFRNLNSFQLRSNKGEARYELIQIYFSRFLIFCIKPKTGSLCPTRTMSHRLPRRSTRSIDVLQVPTNRALPSEISSLSSSLSPLLRVG